MLPREVREAIICSVICPCGKFQSGSGFGTLHTSWGTEISETWNWCMSWMSCSSDSSWMPSDFHCFWLDSFDYFDIWLLQVVVSWRVQGAQIKCFKSQSETSHSFLTCFVWEVDQDPWSNQVCWSTFWKLVVKGVASPSPSKTRSAPSSWKWTWRTENLLSEKRWERGDGLHCPFLRLQRRPWQTRASSRPHGFFCRLPEAQIPSPHCVTSATWALTWQDSHRENVVVKTTVAICRHHCRHAVTEKKQNWKNLKLRLLWKLKRWHSSDKYYFWNIYNSSNCCSGRQWHHQSTDSWIFNYIQLSRTMLVSPQWQPLRHREITSELHQLHLYSCHHWAITDHSFILSFALTASLLFRSDTTKSSKTSSFADAAFRCIWCSFLTQKQAFASGVVWDWLATHESVNDLACCEGHLEIGKQPELEVKSSTKRYKEFTDVYRDVYRCLRCVKNVNVGTTPLRS